MDSIPRCTAEDVEFLVSAMKGSEIDFSTFTVNQIVDMCKRRNIPVHMFPASECLWEELLRMRNQGLPMEGDPLRPWIAMASEINGGDVRDVQEKVRSWKAHAAAMWTRDFQADPDRIGFMSLPRELRDMIYSEAIFNDPQGLQPGTCWNRMTYADGEGKWIWLEGTPGKVLVKRTLCTMQVLEAMSKQIREEARMAFLEQTAIVMENGGIVELDRKSKLPDNMYEHVYRGLQSLSPLDRTSIRAVRVRNAEYLDLSSNGEVVYQSMLSTLGECSRLRHLELTMHISSLFRHDREALEGFLIQAEPLVSKGLESFGAFLMSFDRLKDVRINPYCSVEENHRFRYCTEMETNDPFLAFAFSGKRLVWLWHAVRDYLKQVNVKGRWTTLTVGSPFEYGDRWYPHLHNDQETDFETWMAKRKSSP